MEIGFKEYSVGDREDVLTMMAQFNKIEGYHFDALTREKNLMDFTSNITGEVST